MVAWLKDTSPHNLEPGSVSIGPKEKNDLKMIFKANKILFCLRFIWKQRCMYFLESTCNGLFGKSVALQPATSHTIRKCYKREFYRVTIIINLIVESSEEN